MDALYLVAGVGLFALFGLYAVFLRRICTMVVAVIYIAATAAVAIYMLAALLRPEDF